MAMLSVISPLPLKFDCAAAYFSEEDSDYIHSYEQQGIDDVKEALAEWDAIAS